MRKIAFGYSTRCNIKCAHCVAAGDNHDNTKMKLDEAKRIIRDMAEAGVGGISFTAGEPFIFFDDLLELITLCSELNIYTRVVSNCFWAKSLKRAAEQLNLLKSAGLSQLRMSYSRWHQEHVPRNNVMFAAQGCMTAGIEYFISFVTDFSEEDDEYESFLRDNGLKFFPEPVIYSGRAGTFGRQSLFTDYQENRCAMNPYLAPDLTMYACCDAGSHFNTTHFFKLGNLKQQTVSELFVKSETNPLFNCIRSQGITTIASFAGIKSREIVSYRKCELCKKLFDSPETLERLQDAALSALQRWSR